MVTCHGDIGSLGTHARARDRNGNARNIRRRVLILQNRKSDMSYRKRLALQNLETVCSYTGEERHFHGDDHDLYYFYHFTG